MMPMMPMMPMIPMIPMIPMMPMIQMIMSIILMMMLMMMEMMPMEMMPGGTPCGSPARAVRGIELRCGRLGGGDFVAWTPLGIGEAGSSATRVGLGPETFA